VKKIAAVVAGVCCLGGAAVGFGYMERYVHAASPVAQPAGYMELISPPRWITEALQKRIAEAAGGYSFELGADTARDVALRLERLPWIYNTRVRTTDKTVHVHAEYRKPLACIKAGGQEYYLALVRPGDPIHSADSPKVVLLDRIELNTLPIIEIKGFAAKNIPPVGGAWDAPEITSALELINVLGHMDEISSPDNPLLNDLGAIDVKNFNGKFRNDPHVVLYAKDGTEIRWGAAYGTSRLYMEATEQEKLATLYTFYKEHKNTIQCIKHNICQLIELRYSQKIFPRPE